MNVHCPHCRHEQELPESLINKVVDCPSCRRRFVARRPVAISTPKNRSIGRGLITLLLLLIAGVPLGYICWKQQDSPADLVRQLLQRVHPRSEPIPPPPVTPSGPMPVPEDEPEPTPPHAEPVPPRPEAPSPSEPSPTPPVKTSPLSWLLQTRTRWPQEVALTRPVRFSLKADGEDVGTVLLPVGGLVRLLQIDDYQVTVSYQSQSRTIPMDATDLRARARAEIDRLNILLAFSASRAAAPSTVSSSSAPTASASQTQGVYSRPQTPFVHPGGLHTKADLDRMKTKVAAGEHPWIDGWNLFITDPKAQNSYRAAPGANMPSRQRAQNDATAMYYNALRWYISGDKSYAECAVRIANAWSSTANKRPANDYLSGIPTGSFALAGEVLRVYPGWSASDFARFKTMLLRYWYPKCHEFLTTHGGANETAYWANWDACNMLGVLGIGVLCDDQAKFDEAVEYFKNGKGMGSIKNAVPFRYPGGLGQWQESGRDQAHTMGGQGLLSEFCQVAWNQGLDLFSYADNQLLAGAEYTAQYTLWQGVPYTYYTNASNANQAYISTNYHGRLAASHFELLYNHYIVRQGLKAPNVKRFAELRRPEPGEVDVFGYGTLTYTLDQTASPYPVLPVPPVPQELVATAGLARVDLKWSPSGSYSTDGYDITCATSSSGPYTSIYSTHNWTTPRYTDTAVTAGTTYYYKVAALNNTGSSDFSAPAGATPAASAPLPTGWLAADVGASGSATGGDHYADAANATFIVQATGSGIGGDADNCHIVYKRVTGDFTITARLIERNGDIYKAGLMMREGPSANAKMLAVTLGEIGGRQARFFTRTKTGEPTTTRFGNDYTWLPIWFRLQRQGHDFTASQSPDGITWFPMGTSTADMGNTSLVGLAVASGHKESGAGGSVIFDNVAVAVTPPPSPSAPASLTATAQGDDIQLAWKNNATNQTGFKVEASTDNTLFYEIADLAPDAIHFLNTGVHNSSHLHYRVRAYNTGGYSEYSNTAGLSAP